MDYLLQCVSCDYSSMLDLTEGIHGAFAQRHGLTYVAKRGRVMEECPSIFDAIPFTLSYLQKPDAGLVIWLDADTLIVKDSDPHDVLGNHLVGMSRHRGPPAEHYNAGVMFLKACEATIALFQRVVDNGPGVWPWYQEDFINKYLNEPQWAGKILTLPNEWNSTVVLGHPEQCIIRAWHGYPGGAAGRVKQMELAIAKL